MTGKGPFCLNSVPHILPWPSFKELLGLRFCKMSGSVVWDLFFNVIRRIAG